jgi:preprotein translocase subunit SecD
MTMGKAKKLLTSVRVIVLIVALLLAAVAIRPSFDREGAAIRGVARNSSAMEAGIVSPQPNAQPMSREVILAMSNVPIRTVEDYEAFVAELDINRTVQVKTNKGLYRLTTRARTETITLNETETVTINETVEVNQTIDGETVLVNETREAEVTRPKTMTRVLGMEGIGLTVYEAPTSNLRKGLDLQGGTRVVLRPHEAVSEEDMEIILANMQERLNVFGLSDVAVRKAKDLTGDQFIVVEIPGANEEEVKELLAKQGKFEARIGNETVFRGGSDITYVCRSADCSGIDPNRGCGAITGGVACRFQFAITLTPDAAQRQADITAGLDIVTDAGEQYLSQKIDLYLDDELVDSLNIGADLQGRAVTDIAISGSGAGLDREAAIDDALKSMKRLQTVLITGSLPVKLDVVKADNISPALGKEFVRNAFLVAFVSLAVVIGIVFVRYRRIILAVPIAVTLLAEVTLMLGLAALIGWNLDLASIAGIIVAIGTGVNDQIVIIDEVLKRRGNASQESWKERIKGAFFIIFGAAFTVIAAMIPLLFAGAGLLKGFAFTTIAGVSFGVFITRPAFAAFVETFLKE